MSTRSSLLGPRAAATNYRQAFSLSPSLNWDGNDGAWSSFTIRVGTPSQYFRILPSTNSAETWVPIADSCNRGPSYCGNPRGVAPFNGATSGPTSGSPTGLVLGSLDAGMTCTANKSPMCRHCVSADGKCTDGPCAGRTCCGDTPGQCNSGGCNGISGICTAAYIGCPCPGADYNTGSASTTPESAISPIAAQGFLSNHSSTWTANGNQWIGIEQTLNITSNAQYGKDTVGLGADATTGLDMQGSVVVGIPTEPFYLGSVGLRPSNMTGPGGSNPSFITQLAAQKHIPSLSYGYTAGALYRGQPAFGSLTLGGYDASRLIPNDLWFPIPANASNSLMVSIQSITASETLTLQSNVTLLSGGISAVIDTTLPHMWLPLAACQRFEKEFGLMWDASTQYYLVNDTTHQQLLNSNPSITFTLGRSIDGNHSVNIILPYGAFDLQASNPIYTNGTNYFPLRRATKESQYTLGRAFFQEAYLLVDYETSNFSISQSPYPIVNQSNIITIDHSPKEVPTTMQPSPQSSHILTTASIAGIVIGCISASVFCTLLAIFLFRRRNSNLPLATSPAKHPSFSSGLTSWNSSPNSSLEPSTAYTAELGPAKSTAELASPKKAAELATAECAAEMAVASSITPSLTTQNSRRNPTKGGMVVAPSNSRSEKCITPLESPNHSAQRTSGLLEYSARRKFGRSQSFGQLGITSPSSPALPTFPSADPSLQQTHGSPVSPVHRKPAMAQLQRTTSSRSKPLPLTPGELHEFNYPTKRKPRHTGLRKVAHKSDTGLKVGENLEGITSIEGKSEKSLYELAAEEKMSPPRWSDRGAGNGF